MAAPCFCLNRPTLLFICLFVCLLDVCVKRCTRGAVIEQTQRSFRESRIVSTSRNPLWPKCFWDASTTNWNKPVKKRIWFNKGNEGTPNRSFEFHDDVPKLILNLKIYLYSPGPRGEYLWSRMLPCCNILPLIVIHRRLKNPKGSRIIYSIRIDILHAWLISAPAPAPAPVSLKHQKLPPREIPLKFWLKKIELFMPTNILLKTLVIWSHTVHSVTASPCSVIRTI